MCRKSSIKQPPLQPRPQAKSVEPTEHSIVQESPVDVDQPSCLDHLILEQSYCEEPSLLSHSSSDEHVLVKMHYLLAQS